MDIHGIKSGFVGEGPKTIIPAKGRAKFSFRLVEHQNAHAMDRLVREYIDFYMKQYGGSVRYKISSHSYDNPFYCSIDEPFLQKTAEILSKHFGHKTVFMREGGSIPAAEIIQRVLKKPVVLTGFILPDSNLHAPNENFDEDIFWERIEALRKVYI